MGAARATSRREQVTAREFMLGGVDNRHLYHNSTLALDGETGEIRWYYQ